MFKVLLVLALAATAALAAPGYLGASYVAAPLGYAAAAAPLAYSAPAVGYAAAPLGYAAAPAVAYTGLGVRAAYYG